VQERAKGEEAGCEGGVVCCAEGGLVVGDAVWVGVVRGGADGGFVFVAVGFLFVFWEVSAG
jgi:hypothetical protein